MTNPTTLRSVTVCFLLFAIPLSAPLPAQEDSLADDSKSRTDNSAKNVSPEVQEQAAREAAAKRRDVIEDAVTALRESENALKALDEGRNDDAIEALEKAIGKLELVLALERRLALAPVDVDLLVFDLYATAEAVREAVNRAEELLEDGKVQEMRPLVADLASEIVISVTNLPMATYPEAIKEVAPLIDAGRTDEAKRALEVALSTLVVVDTIFPLPVLRTRLLLEDAQMLAGKEDRTEEENTRLSEHLDSARAQLELGEALGYGPEETFEDFYRQLEEIEAETAVGKSGERLFDGLKEALARAFD